MPEMAENALLLALASSLTAAGLDPPPAAVGIAEPAVAEDLPAIVLSLEELSRAGNGVGLGSAVIAGALAWQASINLANPVLPEEPSLNLLKPERLVLTLPHGGLVKSDGKTGSLTPDDLTVQVAGNARPVVSGAPTGLQVSADPAAGQLTFATPLPATGRVDVTYFVGQWERRVERLAGILRVDVCAAPADAAALSTAVVEALLAPAAKTAVHRLLALGATALGSLGAPEPGLGLRRRTARFSFVFEHEINRPESSGGVIAGIPVTTELPKSPFDTATGATEFILDVWPKPAPEGI